MTPVSLTAFYDQMATLTGAELTALLPSGIQREIGHFNVFNLADLLPPGREKLVMPYDRRAYYKISLIKGRNRAEYANKVPSGYVLTLFQKVSCKYPKRNELGVVSATTVWPLSWSS